VRLTSNPFLWVELENNKVKRLLEDKSQIVLFDTNGAVILDSKYIKRIDKMNKTTYSNGAWFERGNLNFISIASHYS
jgi:hypothetical protein